jgi:thiamine kinase-like enzyme
MIPQEKTAAVTLGLREAFGVSEVEDIRRVTGGHTTSLVFRIVVRGTPFLLKMILRKDDASRHFACMRSAAEAGLAPHVWYTSAEDKIFISDFVAAAPFPVKEALIRVPALLRRLHALPPFPGVPNHLNTTCMFLINKGPAVDAFLQRFRASNIVPESEREELIARFEQMASVYPSHDPDMVSSHNDLFKPDNIVFDGRRAWMVDWEAAFLNDRYVDLAVYSNLVVTNQAEEEVYLTEYFGQPPTPYQRARFFLMQQAAHLFYAIAYLYLGSAAEQVNLREKAPDFRDFHRRIWAGELNLADQQTKILYGMIHRERLLDNLGQARFGEAVRIVSNGHARP